jgi:hypothetical protein
MVQSSNRKRSARPNPRPTHPIARRLELVRERTGHGDLMSFWKALGGTKSGTSYASARRYHFDREPSPDYLARVTATFPEYRLDWLIADRGAMTVAEEEERKRPAITPDPEQIQRTRMAVFQAFGEEAPGLRVIGVGAIDRLILPAVEEVASWLGPAGLNLPGLEDGEGEQKGHRRYVEAARLLGRAVVAPLATLRLEPEYWTQGAKAQYLAAMLPTLATLTDLEHSLGAMMRAQYTAKPAPDSEEEPDDEA